jgi:hypothetical protein
MLQSPKPPEKVPIAGVAKKRGLKNNGKTRT